MDDAWNMNLDTAAADFEQLFNSQDFEYMDWDPSFLDSKGVDLFRESYNPQVPPTYDLGNPVQGPLYSNCDLANQPIESLSVTLDLASNKLKSTPKGDSVSKDMGNPKPKKKSRHAYGPKANRAKISPEAKGILEEYYTHNIYPVHWEIDILAHQAKLEPKQVRTWFSNARARNKPADEDSHATENNENHRTVTTKLSQESLEKLGKELPSDTQRSMTEYLSSSIQDEPANSGDIRAAIEANGIRGPSSPTNILIPHPSRRARSIASTRASSRASSGTVYSGSSRGSRGSNISRGSRRGRKRVSFGAMPYPHESYYNTRQRSPSIKIRTSDSLDYASPEYWRPALYCTFCGLACGSKYDWVRHQETVHVERRSWICCPADAEMYEKCPFCGFARPDNEHLQHAHRINSCIEHPTESKSFYRKDNFIQHLHKIHLNSSHPCAKDGCKELQDFGCEYLVRKWERKAPPLPAGDSNLHCGFCGKVLENWEARCDHVASHFTKDGKMLKAWWPERRPIDEYDPEVVGHDCSVWSCRFLDSFTDIATSLDGTFFCCVLCKVLVLYEEVEIHGQQHGYRDCDQQFYNSEVDFAAHLTHSHGAQVSPSNVAARLNAYSKTLVPLTQCRRLTTSGSNASRIPDKFPRDFFTWSSPEQSEDEGCQQSKDWALELKSVDRVEFPPNASPRFFRSYFNRLYYLRSSYQGHSRDIQKADLDEIPYGHIGSLVMASGLLSLRTAGIFPTVQKVYGSEVIAIGLD